MLKALELIGFKSFADATRFDFPDGITVVVGPNGSGKSNIVDAIKWVLGSQSAKSLRGGEMSDVIFKGSAATGRKPANSAEATLVLDNQARLMDMDADEITVTRRVYRSGESEYLINREPCRLRDVKDLFRGTGVGVDAYSLIEQGKVDRMLQASPKDRRAIFEEAAGISRFKAKKVEAERRLGRVNQNLLRLSDIVDEVHTRLSAIKSQASKAARYRQMTEKAGVLRLQIGHAEMAELLSSDIESNLQIEIETAKQTELQEQLANLQTAAAQSRQQAELIAADLQRCTASHYECQHEATKLNSQNQSTLDRLNELQQEQSVLEQQCQSLQLKASLTDEQILQRQTDLRLLQTNIGESSDEVTIASKAVEFLAANRTTLEEQIETARQAIEALRRDEAASQSDLLRLQLRQEQAAAMAVELAVQIATTKQSLEALQTTRAKIESRLQDAEEQVIAQEKVRAEFRHQTETYREALRCQQEAAIVLQSRQQTLIDRLDLLTQLDAQRSELGEGARKLIEYSKSKSSAPWDSIHGLVADLIDVEVHLAPLVDVSLAHLSEAIVLGDGQIVDMLQNNKLQIEGRATLLRLDRMPSRRAGDRIQLDGLRGVIGRADRMVHCDSTYMPLATFLLGTTWLVDTLQTALDLSHYRGSGLRFVTAACERIDTDGTIHIGTLQTLSGILTRRSEIHVAEDEKSDLLKQFETSAHWIVKAQQNLTEHIATEVTLENQYRQVQRDAEAIRFELQAALNKEDQAVRTIADQTSQQSQYENQAAELLSSIDANLIATMQLAESMDAKQIELAQHRELLIAHREQVSIANEALSQAKIKAAKFEHQLTSDQVLLAALVNDRSERGDLVLHSESQLLENATRQKTSQETIERIAVELHSVAEKLAAAQTQRASAEEQNKALTDTLAAREKEVTAASTQLDRCVGLVEQFQATCTQNEQRRAMLLQHYQADYQIDLVSPPAEDLLDESFDRAASHQELTLLRNEIAAVGSVNMEALAELDDLQVRYDSLNSHYLDLVTARDNLLKIIERINDKSREMFLATLSAVRSNFQTLYRRSFGGGSADIVLEDPNDVLNCGVEVIATPPGKIALSNSLLSGGEKALTAVALIMAIFQFRPSPFCILDEVDAPFDEANIGRFVNVLKEFLHMTKFIVVSHSKKTMTVANTIYGVTMQESGISTQVSVRFEEVGDDGEILASNATPKLKVA